MQHFGAFMLSKSSKQPSPAYAFVVISLAAFLILFTIVRRPQTQYITHVRIPVNLESANPGAVSTGTADKLAPIRSVLLSPEFVLDSLRQAGMVQGDTTPALKAVATEIVSRMQIAIPNRENLNDVRLLLATDHPSVGMKMLDQMMADLKQHEIASELGLGTLAAAHAGRIRGSAIAAPNLLLLIMTSALVGLGCLVWLDQTNRLSQHVVLTTDDVTAVTGLPVLADFMADQALPARDQRQSRRFRFRLAMRGAEASVATVALLMVVNVATVQAFSDLLIHDPLTAYSEALTRISS